MVRLTGPSMGVMRTFGLYSKGKAYNHRVPFKYQKFQAGIDPEEIIAHYSREDIDTINPREGRRTYKDAQRTLGRSNYLLKNLRPEDVEANKIYQEESDRQRAIVARVDKIRVIVDSNPGKGVVLMMNKDISTPYDCAKHIHQLVASRSAVAEILPLEDDKAPSSNEGEETQTEDITANAESAPPIESKETNHETALVNIKKTPSSTYWDMHRALPDNCRLRFRHFREKQVGLINKVYWRSCSFVMGMAIRMAFKQDIKVALHSWPKPDIKTGSFVYDVALNLSETWKPTEQELRAFTKILWNIKSEAIPFERLDVSPELAKKIFASNPFKIQQLDSVLKSKFSNGKISIYRCGGLLDMSVGPMISSTDQIGRITLASVHPFESKSDDFKGIFYRFQGVSLPQELPMSSFLYQNVLINRAKSLNKTALLQ